MRITSLKYFHEVAELKSISKVSNELHISQPALSHQLSKLEKELDVKLFERSNRGVELTQKGKVLYNYSKEMINLYNNLINEISEEDQKEEVTINIMNIYAGLLITNIAKEIGSIFKNTSISINRQIENNEKALLLHNRADVILGCKKVEDIDLSSIYIGSDRLILVSKEHRKFSCVEDLAIALLDNEIDLFLNECEEFKNSINICLKTDSFDVIKSFLKSQDTAAILPSSAIKKELESGELKRICGCNYEMVYDLYISYRKDIDIKLKRKVNTLKKELEQFLINK